MNNVLTDLFAVINKNTFSKKAIMAYKSGLINSDYLDNNYKIKVFFFG